MAWDTTQDGSTFWRPDDPTQTSGDPGSFDYSAISQFDQTGAPSGGAAPPAPAPAAAPAPAPGSQPFGPPGAQVTPNQFAALAPQPLQAFGALPQVSPTFSQAAQATAPTAPNPATIDPNSAQAYLNQFAGLLGTQVAPQFAQQQRQLQDQLAGRGISSSGAAGQLTNDLLGQQAGAYAGALSPMVGQAFGYQQQDLSQNQNAINAFLSKGYDYQEAVTLANQAMQQQTNLANQGAANQAAGTNAGYYDQALTGNANAYNGFQSQLYGSGAGLLGNELTAYLNSFGPNSGVQSTMNQGLAGTQAAYGNAYSAAESGQGSVLAGLGQGAGAYFGGAAAARAAA